MIMAAKVRHLDDQQKNIGKKNRQAEIEAREHDHEIQLLKDSSE